jgi:hypothetical protein
LGLTQLSGQLSRRSSELHFARYRFDDVDERHMFGRVLYTFQQQLPLAEAPDLVGQLEYIYERCVGCVGVLKTWLTQALAAALADDASTLTRAMLDRWAIPLPSLMRMAREIADGEAMLHDRADQAGNLRTVLGMDGATAPSSRTTTASRGSKRPKRPVGQRTPTRDPVGEVTCGE